MQHLDYQATTIQYKTNHWHKNKYWYTRIKYWTLQSETLSKYWPSIKSIPNFRFKVACIGISSYLMLDHVTFYLQILWTMVVFNRIKCFLSICHSVGYYFFKYLAIFRVWQICLQARFGALTAVFIMSTVSYLNVTLKINCHS